MTYSIRYFSGLLFLLVLCSTGHSDDRKGPERWESSILEFVQRDRANAPKPGSLLFVGSSSIRMWKLEDSWPRAETINNGFGGSTLADSIHYFDQLFLRYDPKAIILYAGDNDIAKGLTPEQVSDDFRTLASLLTLAHPEVPVVFIAIKPSTKRWEMWPDMKKANDLIASQCEDLAHFYFADIGDLMLKGSNGPPAKDWFIEDGLHLSASGYRRWTSLIQSILEEATGKPSG